MKRTISLKLLSSSAQERTLERVQAMFAGACNAVVRYASENKCNNNVALHHICYYSVREQFNAFGSQMVCQSIRAVTRSYKTLFLMAVLICACIFPVCIKLPEFRADQNAKIETAVTHGAPPVELNGFCVDRKVYLKDDKGNWVYLTVQDKALECRDRPAEK